MTLSRIVEKISLEVKSLCNSVYHELQQPVESNEEPDLVSFMKHLFQPAPPPPLKF